MLELEFTEPTKYINKERKMTLFTYSTEFNVLKDLMENDVEVNEETGEFIDNSKVIADLFGEISMNFDNKLNDSQRWIIEQEACADTLKAEAKRLSAKATALQNRADRVRELMKGAIVATGETKYKTDLFSFFIKKSESVQVLSEDELPREYLRIKREADKIKIKEALKKGEHIEGCSIVEKLSLGVK